MNANLSNVKPVTSSPELVDVTTLFLKPTFGITVQSNTLSVCVKAHPEVVNRPRSHSARG